MDREQRWIANLDGRTLKEIGAMLDDNALSARYHEITHDYLKKRVDRQVSEAAANVRFHAIKSNDPYLWAVIEQYAEARAREYYEESLDIR